MKLTTVTLPRVTLTNLRIRYVSTSGEYRIDDALPQAALCMQSGGYLRLQNGGLILLNSNING